MAPKTKNQPADPGINRSAPDPRLLAGAQGKPGGGILPVGKQAPYLSQPALKNSAAQFDRNVTDPLRRFFNGVPRTNQEQAARQRYGTIPSSNPFVPPAWNAGPSALPPGFSAGLPAPIPAVASAASAPLSKGKVAPASAPVTAAPAEPASVPAKPAAKPIPVVTKAAPVAAPAAPAAAPVVSAAPKPIPVATPAQALPAAGPMAEAVAPVAAPAATPLPAKQGIPGEPEGRKVKAKGYTPPIEPPAETPFTGIFAPDAAQPPAPQLGNLGLGYTAGGMTPRLGSGAMNPFNLGDAPQVQDGTTDVTRADRGQGYNPTSPLDLLFPAPGVEQVINPAGLQQATPQESRDAKFQHDPVGLALANAGAAAQPALDYWKDRAQGFGKGLVTAARDARDTLLAANRPSEALGGVRPLSHILAGLATIGSGARVGQEVFKSNEATNQEPAKLASGLADATAERKLREAQTGETLARVPGIDAATAHAKALTGQLGQEMALKKQDIAVRWANARTAQAQNAITRDANAWQKEYQHYTAVTGRLSLSAKDPATQATDRGLNLPWMSPTVDNTQVRNGVAALTLKGQYKDLLGLVQPGVMSDISAGTLAIPGEGGKTRPATGDDYAALNKLMAGQSLTVAELQLANTMKDIVDRRALDLFGKISNTTPPKTPGLGFQPPQ